MPSACGLPFRGAAHQFFHLTLGRTAGVFARLERIVCLAFFADRPLGFLAFVSGECFCICHECCNSFEWIVAEKTDHSAFCFAPAGTDIILLPTHRLPRGLDAPAAPWPKSRRISSRLSASKPVPAGHTSRPISSNRSEGIVP